MRKLMPMITVVSVLLLAVPATAGPPPPGCPPAQSIWTDVSYVPPPADPALYEATSFWRFYFVDTGGGAQLMANTGWTAIESYEWIVGLIDANLDKNADDHVCVWWIGSRPGLDDSLISVVDNNARVPW